MSGFSVMKLYNMMFFAFTLFWVSDYSGKWSHPVEELVLLLSLIGYGISLKAIGTKEDIIDGL